MYSSGTTGLPKGIVHSHRTRMMYTFLWGMEYGVTFDSVVMSAGSLVFNGSLIFMFPAICSGATYVVLPKFSADTVLDAFHYLRVSHTMLVPAQIIQMLESPRFDQTDFGALKCLLTLGSPLAVERKRELVGKLPNVLFELYGLTEGFMTTLRPPDVMRKLGSVGPAMPLNEAKIVDDYLNELPVGEVGEVLGKGPTLMAGYYNNPEATENAIHQNSWMRTGDLGRMDEDGFIYLVDRKKDMIKSGGISVYPKDIEEVVATHPDVSEVAVFGVVHPKWDEVPYAQVILKSGHSISEEELLTWINEHVSAKFQRLYGLQIVQDFPRSSAGKTLKRVMRDSYKPQ
jgi:acyl-CoA synthetase (AMP-forming)/AMP-acid ligase II